MLLLMHQTLLEEVVEVLTKEDNQMMKKIPTDQEILEVLNDANLQAAPGTDGLPGLPGLLYKECWVTSGQSLSEVVRDIFMGEKPPASMRTSIMVFGAKPEKTSSILPKDKRKISLLNADFKVITGLEARRLKATAGHTLSHLQLVADSN